VKALVTGGGGFLGKAIVGQLLARGDTVRSYSRGEYPELCALGVETFQGDLADADALDRAADGCDVVFHVAAKADVWGRYADFYQANVNGTRNVVDACLCRSVKRLVYTSSPSVAFSGEDQNGVDESEPYPKEFLSHYPRTKALGEAIALESNGPDLATVALRPHLIWGPGDTNLVPRIVERAKRGKLRIAGDGQQRIDAVYIDNAARAHVLAADALGPEAACAGNAYYITNDEPWAIEKVLNGILEAAGLPPVTKRVSPGVAYAAGSVFECIYTLLGKKQEPPMTRFVARQLAMAHWYDISAAKRDLGYAPDVSMDEGMRRLAESFQAKR